MRLPPAPTPAPAGADDPALGNLRGSPPPTKTPQPRSPTSPVAPGVSLRPVTRLPDPLLMSPSLATPVAPRLDRSLEARAGGGAQCRTKCADELYQCQGGEGGDHCTQTWGKCVLACPSASAAPL
jgi:hypothetical protein